MTAENTTRYPVNIPEGPDRDKARGFLSGKVNIETAGNSTKFTIDDKTLELGKINPSDQALVKSILETLLVEKSVCEARMYLAATCKPEVVGPGITPLLQKGDIEFNPSFWRGNTGVVRYEVLQQIFNTNSVRPIAYKIVNFINSFPENYIPKELIALPYNGVDSYTASKRNEPIKTAKK